MNELQQRVEADIRQHGLLRPGQAVLVAVSGGLDSMVLLTMLCRLAASARWRLSVAHFNHAWRGRDSDEDERFVRVAARRCGLPFLSARMDSETAQGAAPVGPALSSPKGPACSPEMAAREARHAFLSRAAGEAGVRTIALAHQADDQVELFLLRLLRGAGVQGLAGMRWSGPSPADPRYRLIRPLLGCNRPELETFAREHRIRWRVDASNSCTDMLRNRVRHELLPLLERRYQPGLRCVVRREMELLAGTAGLLSQLSRDWRESRREPWGDLAVALQRQVLCDELFELGVKPDFDLVEQLRLRPGFPICTQSDVTVWAMADGRVIKARPSSRPTPAFVPEEIRVPLSGLDGKGIFDGLGWRWKIGRTSMSPRFGPGREWFDADKVGAEVVLRHWQPGDRFRPSGMSRLVKLQDLFTNLKIPLAARRKLIVATTAAGQLWWVEGIRIAEDFKLRPDTVRRLAWFWKRDQPLISPG